MAQSYGAAASYTATFAGPYNANADSVKIREITLSVSAWKGGESPYTQSVEVEGITVNSVADLVADAQAQAILSDSRCVVHLENDEGTITAVAVGGKPKKDLTLQVIVQEGIVV